LRAGEAKPPLRKASEIVLVHLLATSADSVANEARSRYASAFGAARGDGAALPLSTVRGRAPPRPNQA
jgi:hypothetical protein